MRTTESSDPGVQLWKMRSAVLGDERSASTGCPPGPPTRVASTRHRLPAVASMVIVAGGVRRDLVMAGAGQSREAGLRTQAARRRRSASGKRALRVYLALASLHERPSRPCSTGLPEVANHVEAGVVSAESVRTPNDLRRPRGVLRAHPIGERPDAARRRRMLPTERAHGAFVRGPSGSTRLLPTAAPAAAVANGPAGTRSSMFQLPVIGLPRNWVNSNGSSA
jgi:hypothetical protein